MCWCSWELDVSGLAADEGIGDGGMVCRNVCVGCGGVFMYWCSCKSCFMSKTIATGAIPDCTAELICCISKKITTEAIAGCTSELICCWRSTGFLLFSFVVCWWIGGVVGATGSGTVEESSSDVLPPGALYCAISLDECTSLSSIGRWKLSSIDNTKGKGKEHSLISSRELSAFKCSVHAIASVASVNSGACWKQIFAMVEPSAEFSSDGWFGRATQKHVLHPEWNKYFRKHDLYCYLLFILTILSAAFSTCPEHGGFFRWLRTCFWVTVPNFSLLLTFPR